MNTTKAQCITIQLQLKQSVQYQNKFGYNIQNRIQYT